jgi:hypothetical protein
MVNNPRISGVDQPMLQEDYRSTGFQTWICDSIHTQNITIICFCFEFREDEAILLDNLLKRKLVIGWHEMILRHIVSSTVVTIVIGQDAWEPAHETVKNIGAFVAGFKALLGRHWAYSCQEEEGK